MGKLLRNHIQDSMKKLSLDGYVFLGYNTALGSHMYNTLKDINSKQVVEMPVAENLMMGIAIGMALNGDKVCVCFERHDFLLLALDQIVNHLDKMEELSKGQFTCPNLIIRAIVGSDKPLDPGIQHKADYTNILKQLVTFPVIPVETKEDTNKYLEHSDQPRIFVEWRKLFDRSDSHSVVGD